MDIKFSKNSNKIEIEGFTFFGFQSEDEKCPECGNLKFYYELYDAFFCAYCNEWLENPSEDWTGKKHKAPEKPLPVKISE